MQLVRDLAVQLRHRIDDTLSGPSLVNRQPVLGECRIYLPYQEGAGTGHGDHEVSLRDTADRLLPGLDCLHDVFEPLQQECLWCDVPMYVYLS